MAEVSTPLGDVPVVPVLLVTVGAYLAWFGVHYWRSAVAWPSDPLKAVLTGKGLPDNSAAPLPSATASSSSTSSVGGATSGGTATSGDRIAAAALGYAGQGYVWGGPADRPGNWDCSSFVSYVLGHDLGMPLPGGRWGDPGFPPHAHGPTSTAYHLYGTVINRFDVTAGDLIVWPTHVAIATSASQMISAVSPSEGTRVEGIDNGGPMGETPTYRRISYTAPASTSTAVGSKRAV